MLPKPLWIAALGLGGAVLVSQLRKNQRVGAVNQMVLVVRLSKASPAHNFLLLVSLGGRHLTGVL